MPLFSSLHFLEESRASKRFLCIFRHKWRVEKAFVSKYTQESPIEKAFTFTYDDKGRGEKAFVSKYTQKSPVEKAIKKIKKSRDLFDRGVGK
jgi:hypothetical protein